MKKILTFILIISITLFLFFAFLSLKQEQKLSIQSHLNYMVYFKHVKNLIIATQKTRGLTNYYLNGDVGAKMLIFDEQRDMKDSMEAIEALKLHESIKIDHLYRDIKRELIHLNKVAFSQNSSQLFHLYSLQVENLLALADKIITLFFSKNRDLNFSIETLLPLTENIGKLRGLGSGLLARGSITQAERQQMQGFMTQINILFQQERRYLASASHLDATMKSLEEKSLQMIQSYLEKTTLYVLHPKKKVLTADSYFREGTKNISEVMIIFDKIYEQSKTNLENDYQNLSLYIMLIWLGVVLVILLLWYLYIPIINVNKVSSIKL